MNNENHHSSNFWSGFWMGAIVGALVVFLFATKKGKRLLKMITEEGGEGISELEELFSKEPKSSKPSNGHVAPESSLEKMAAKGSEIAQNVASKGRRLFKGIPKKR